ncbi:MAG TPA: serine/threonine-protein kinase, partial [Micromonosporaceae bacterium]|nr:serine/threonine-protein kinase [Micromonosporaceae bacterium]
MPPAVLARRYELLSELGRGSMGTVWRARDLRFDRLVAVKMVRLGNTAAGFEGQLAGRFDREILALGRLNHPNIAVAYDAGREGDQMYLVTELVAGQSLAELVRERNADGLGPFPIDAALDIAAQVCNGLAVAHRAGVVHRDLKPANLMVSDAAEVKIVDFGIARLVEDNLPRLTQPGTMVGTLAYGSPEQLEGKVVDGRSDLYALGC